MISTKLLSARLNTVSAYRGMLELPAVASLQLLLSNAKEKDQESAIAFFCETFFRLQEEGFSSLGSYFRSHLLYDTAPYPDLAAAGNEDTVLTNAARRDVALFRELSSITREEWCEMLCSIGGGCDEVIDDLPCWECAAEPFTFDELTAFYRANGSGVFSRYKAFLWQDRELHPIEKPDFLPAEHLVGYQTQRKQVYENTASLVAGNRANNVLLFGESGTGKSATVKSMLGFPEFESLRMIEVDKSQLDGIPALIRQLGHRPQKFIVYIDDLSFDKDDHTYSLLKTILEGGLETKPINVAIYATSNRRHLVKENFSDRNGDEVDANETIQEKTSLSERFGLRISYLTLDQERFLNMVSKLAEDVGLHMRPEQLRAQAVRWSIRHPGRTPRVAQQFIQSMLALEESSAR